MRTKDLEAKRNHHYVWANYMKRWSDDAINVWYTTKKKNIRRDSVKNIAKEKDFYQISHLSPEHIQVIKAWSSNSPKDLQKIHMDYLNDYLKIQSLESIYKKSNIQDIVLNKMLHAMKCNSMENLHSSHEREVISILDALANRELNILNNLDNMISFIAFWGQQCSRTKNFKERFFSPLIKTKDRSLQEVKKLTEECWWFISYILGINMSNSLFLDRKEYIHCLLVNETNIPFITSDQPIINVHPAINHDIFNSIPPQDHECDFYYPISPHVAYMINKSNRFPAGECFATTDIVDEMNTKIAKNADIYIIGNSEISLVPYKKNVGKQLEKIKEYKK